MEVAVEHNILRILNQKPIAYYPLYAQMTNSTLAGIVLSQLMYWFSKKDKFYKTNEDIITETGLTPDELKSAKNKIKQHIDFITIAIEGLPAKTYYQIDWDLYYSHFEKSVGGNPTNLLGEIPPTRWGESHQLISQGETAIPEITPKTTPKNKEISPQGTESVSESVSCQVKSETYSRDEISLLPDVIKFLKTKQEQGLFHQNFNKPIDERNPVVINSMKTIGQLLRIEKESVDDIRQVLNAAVDDSFWRKNLISLASLRTVLKNGVTKYYSIKNNIDHGKDSELKSRVQAIKKMMQERESRNGEEE